MIPLDYTTKLFFETKNIVILLFENCVKTKKLEKKLINYIDRLNLKPIKIIFAENLV
tara:strand:+ start:234 stop:404 length:171 start_codon:yes stop_codon:yes gene_type:complete